MDVTTLTNEELAALMNEAEAERQKRNTEARLMDAAWTLVQDAKNNGYTKGQVVSALADVVNGSYGGEAA